MTESTRGNSDESHAAARPYGYSVAFVAPSRFIGGGRWGLHYWRPRRITLRTPDRPRIYRWIVWNFMLGGGQRG